MSSSDQQANNFKIRSKFKTDDLSEEDLIRFRNLFETIDVNHDGHIEIDELTIAIKGTAIKETDHDGNTEVLYYLYRY